MASFTYAPEYIEALADKFAAKIERNGGEAPCRTAGESLAVVHSSRFEIVRLTAAGFNYSDLIYRVREAA
jgi:hypothetical protein